MPLARTCKVAHADFVTGALSHCQVQISWQAQHFREVGCRHCVAGAIRNKVKYRFRGRRSTFASSNTDCRRSTFARLGTDFVASSIDCCSMERLLLGKVSDVLLELRFSTCACLWLLLWIYRDTVLRSSGSGSSISRRWRWWWLLRRQATKQTVEKSSILQHTL